MNLSEKSFTYLGDYIKAFTERKIGEAVQLDLKTEILAVKSTASKGSIVLGMLWMKVLQHGENFPVQRVAYQRYRDGTTGHEKMLLRTSDVLISVNLGNGTLEIQGPCVHTWFKHHFINILRRYDGFADTVDWYSKEDVDTEEYRSRGKGFVASRPVVLGVTTEGRSFTAQEELLNRVDRDFYRSIWRGPVLDAQLLQARQCAVRDGSQFVAKLWRSVLHRWLSEPATRVYVVSRNLDVIRLNELCNLLLRHKQVGEIEAVYVPSARSLREALANEQSKRSAQDSLWLEYKLLDRLRLPLAPFDCNFVAGVRLGEAEVLVTSGAFCREAMDVDCRQTIHFFNCSEAVFFNDFVQPLQTRPADVD